MSRLKVLAAQPRIALGALLTLAARRRRRRRLRRGLHGHFGQPGEHVRRRHAQHRQLQGGRRASSPPAACSPAGPAATGTVDIENDGEPQRHVHARRAATPRRHRRGVNPLSGKLNVTVVDCGTFVGATAPNCGDGDDVSKYSGGTIAADGHARPPDSGARHYAAGEKHRYEFTVQLDGSRRQRVPGRHVERRSSTSTRRRLTAGTEAAMGHDDEVRRAGRFASGAALAVAVLAALVVLGPALCGWQRYAIVSRLDDRHLRPAGRSCSTEVVPVATLKVGDVITYLPPAGAGPDHLITHRIACDRAATTPAARVPHQGRREPGRRPVDVPARRADPGARPLRRPVRRLRARARLGRRDVRIVVDRAARAADRAHSACRPVAPARRRGAAERREASA